MNGAYGVGRKNARRSDTSAPGTRAWVVGVGGRLRALFSPRASAFAAARGQNVRRAIRRARVPRRRLISRCARAPRSPNPARRSARGGVRVRGTLTARVAADRGIGPPRVVSVSVPSLPASL